MAFARWDPHPRSARHPAAPGPVRSRARGLEPAGRSPRNARSLRRHRRSSRACAATTSRSSMHDGRLTLSGTRRERGAPCEQYHRVERGHGSFSRTFQLPDPGGRRTHRCRPARRRADGDVPEVGRRGGAPHPRFVIDDRPPPDPLAATAGLRLRRGARDHRPHARGGQRRRRAESGAPLPRVGVAGAGTRGAGDAAGLHARGRTDRPGRREHLVAAGGPPPEFAVQQRSVLPVLLRRRRRHSDRAAASNAASAPASSSATTGSSSPTTTSSPASRDGFRCGSCPPSRWRSATSARSRRRSSASIPRPTWRC